jgi:hypothetical protein
MAANPGTSKKKLLGVAEFCNEHQTLTVENSYGKNT